MSASSADSLSDHLRQMSEQTPADQTLDALAQADDEKTTAPVEGEGADVEPIFTADASGPVPAEVSSSSTGVEALAGQESADLAALAASGDDVQTTVAMPDPLTTAPGAAKAPRPAQPRPARKPSGSLKAFAVPVLVTIGILTLLPALWGTALLAGVQVPAHDQDGATTMAAFMLVCWPIALALFGIAGMLIRQIRRQKRRAQRAPRAL